VVEGQFSPNLIIGHHYGHSWHLVSKNQHFIRC
jgi:hypothetical protein